MSVLVRNVSPFGDLELPGLGLVKFGAEIEVDDETAGVEASPWRPATEDDPHWLTRPSEAEGAEDGAREAYDPGSGLLSGPHFVRVTPAAPVKTPKQAPAAPAVDEK